MTNEQRIKSNEIEAKRKEIRKILQSINDAKTFHPARFYLGNFNMTMMVPAIPDEVLDIVLLIVETTYEKRLNELNEEHEAL